MCDSMEMCRTHRFKTTFVIIPRARLVLTVFVLFRLYVEVETERHLLYTRKRAQ